MNRPNFQKEMEQILAGLQVEKTGRKKLLLHSCCGPCSSYVLTALTHFFDIELFYYNPNIHPAEEYAHRLQTQKQLCQQLPREGTIEVLEDVPYDPEAFFSASAGLEGEKEGGRRCEVCFRLRLEKTALEAKKQGKIRFIGITNHRLHIAKEAIASGLYDTMQFPFCYLATEKDLEIVNLCKEKQMGFIAMKALSGGLITNAKAAAAFIGQYDHVLPIWGIQREKELDEFLSFVDNPPQMTEEIAALISKDKKDLSGNFCRGCGYCLPCPAQIEIPNSARMSLLLRRMPSAPYLTPEWQEKMSRIENCIHCNHCSDHCPYGLDTPKLLRENWEDYQTFLK